MIVCAHGNVAEYCEAHGMTIGSCWDGDLLEYDGGCRVLVTDIEISESEYYVVKGVMMTRGIEIISVKYGDDLKTGRRQNSCPRQPFGFSFVNGEVREHPEKIAVARRIIELHDRRMTYREIQADVGVHHPDGRNLSLGTIQKIVKNRNKYGG